MPIRRRDKRWRKMRVRICKRHGYICHYCREKMHEGEPGKPKALRATLDHVVPLSRGGSNHTSNLVPACYGCNNDRNRRMTAEDYVWVSAEVEIAATNEVSQHIAGKASGDQVDAARHGEGGDHEQHECCYQKDEAKHTSILAHSV